MITGITRRDQVNAVAAAAGLSAVQAREALDAVSVLVKVGLLTDARFAMAGVGTFVVNTRSSRRVTNPRTGLMMDLPAKAVVKFKPSPDLSSSVEEHYS
jgi:DNA-binding protein HU-beta